MTSNYETLAVPVEGGLLHVGRWGHGEHVVVAAHGITATHRWWRAVAGQLGEGVTLLAPDLRGRGRSNAIAAPLCLEAHADDLVAVLDQVGVAQATFLGHSMGGFVAVIAAVRHPSRVARLVLVDGGLPLDLGPPAQSAQSGRPIADLVAAVIGPALDRLRMTFASTEAYLDYWRAHPALGADWNPHMVDAFTYDLEGAPPALRSGVREAAVMADAETQFVGDLVARACDSLRQPVLLIRAPAGLMGHDPPLYSDRWTAQWQLRQPGLRSVTVPGVNHYTILFTERGAGAVAAIVHDEMQP